MAGSIAFITLIFLFLNADYRIGVYGCAIWFACGIIYFGVYGRKTLVYSPEEAFAVRHTADSVSK